MTVIYCTDLFSYNAKDFQTLVKITIFANSFRVMLKLRFTVNEVAWQFNSLACSSGIYKFFQVTIQFQSVIQIQFTPISILYFTLVQFAQYSIKIAVKCFM